MAKRPCLTCGKPTKGTYCEQHEVKLTRQQRGYTNDWYRLVAKAKERQPFCSVCGHTGSPDNPLTGDHILAKARGGANILENIDIKCRSCNSRKGKRLS